MSRTVFPKSVRVHTRPASVVATFATFACAVLTTACDFGPFDMDPRFQSLGDQLDETAMLVAAERAADVFDPAAPLNAGAALGQRHAAMSARVISSGGRRPDLSTASADPDVVLARRLGTTSVPGQTIVVEGAVRLLPGFPVSQRAYRLLGLDVLGRAARTSASGSGDASNDLVTSWGGRLGLLSDSAGRNGLSVSIEGAKVPGANYDAALSPVAPATGARVGLEVSAVRVTAFRLQGSASRGAWGVTGGLGSTNGNFRFRRRAMLVYADSTSLADDVRGDAWQRATANVGVTRELGRVEVSLQYGFVGSPSRTGQLETEKWNTTLSRHSVSLGAQVRF